MLKRGNGEDNPKELESNSDRMSKEASRRESWTHSQVPDLSFLSNNFSTDSIDASSLPETKTHSEISHSSLPSSRSPANRTFPLGESNAGIASDGNFAQNSNQYFSNQDKMNGRSPAVRPKSVFLTGNLNATIQTDETRRNGQASLKRHSFHYSSKSGYPAQIVALVVIMTWITSTLFYDSNTISDMLSTKDEKRRKNQDGLGGYLNNLQERESSTNERIFKIEPLKVDVDEASTLFVASTLCYAGWKLVTTLGGILLISFPYTEYDYSVLKSSVTEQIMGLDIFKPAYSLNHLFITKVNYQLYIAGVKITMKGGSSDDESRMLFEVSRIFDNAMKAFEKDSKVEITIDIDRI
ncbi:hypothetical protein CXQ85_000575 [Candidozyma haemuli]|uniref:Uncharacterized protein n=1 Tax=Candidozyma haemuli TaxID=45357 RepID=A0A2V1AW97_9ASCO|nr:hypothetical protein CXQ85_000575 [[Candida] haemuloni]PVH21593.1 hypothetical protein CXQ85_000575 [[Candida] haemuloni]